MATPWFPAASAIRNHGGRGQMKLRVGTTSASEELDLFATPRHRLGGARLFVSLEGMYTVFGFDQYEYASKWINNMSDNWCNATKGSCGIDADGSVNLSSNNSCDPRSKGITGGASMGYVV